MLKRIRFAHEAGVPIMAYGFCIAAIFGKLEPHDGTFLRESYSLILQKDLNFLMIHAIIE